MLKFVSQENFVMKLWKFKSNRHNFGLKFEPIKIITSHFEICIYYRVLIYWKLDFRTFVIILDKSQKLEKINPSTSNVSRLRLTH